MSTTYYDLLDSVRRDGDWEAWVAFFCEGVASVSDGAVATARRLLELAENDRDSLTRLGRKAGSVECALLALGPDACAVEATTVREPAAPAYGDTPLGGYRRRKPDEYDRTLSLLPLDVLSCCAPGRRAIGLGRPPGSVDDRFARTHKSGTP